MFRRALRLFFGEQMPANARLQAPGAPGALHHRRLTDALRRQPRQTIAHVVARHTLRPLSTTSRMPSIVRLVSAMLVAPPCGGQTPPVESLLLLGQRQRPIQWAKIGIARHLAGQSLQHPIDLRHARQEQQQRSRLLGQQPLHRRRYAIFQPLMAGQRLIQTLNREAAPLGHHYRRFRQHLRQASVVQGGRHDQQFQIVAQPLLHVEQQRQRQIGLQAAFVELIEDHQRHTLQFGVLLQHAGENAFRHHFQPGLRPAFTFGAHAVAHGLAGFLPSCCARR